MSRLQERTEYFSKKAVPHAQTIGNIKASAQAIPRYMWLSLATQVGSPQRQGALSRVEEYQKRLVSEVGTLIESTSSETLKVKVVELQSEIAPLFSVLKQGVTLIGDGKDDSARLLLQESMPPYAIKVSDLSNELSHMFQQESIEASNQANEIVKSANLQFRLISLIASLLIILGGFAMVRALTQHLTLFTSGLGETSNVLTFATNQLSISSRRIMDASHSQATAIDKTATAVEEISSMIKQTSDSTDEVMRLSETSKTEAVQGSEIVTQMINAMDAIDASNQQMANQVKDNNLKFTEILNTIRDIQSRTKVIDDIVFQTKLLSFNASVEAARAGEMGKGFSVVAEEVGKLAEMSGEASKGISNVISESVLKTESLLKETQESVVRMTDSSKEKVENGIEVSKQCGVILNKIVSSSSSVTSMVSEVALAGKEQSNGIEEISRAIHELNQAIRQNSEAAKVSQQMSAKLFDETKGLRSSAGTLKKEIDGKPLVSKFVWSDEFSLHIEKMDQEHINLVEKINCFAECLDHSPYSERSNEAFQDLANTAVAHFTSEESFMKSIHFSEYDGHKKIHEKLVAGVLEVGQSLKNRTIDPTAVMNFLNDWLVGHILGQDMKYADIYLHRSEENKMAA